MPSSKRTKLMVVFGAVFVALGVICWATLIFVGATLRTIAAEDLMQTAFELPVIRGDLTKFMPERDPLEAPDFVLSASGEDSSIVFSRLQSLQKPGLRKVWNELVRRARLANSNQDIESDGLAQGMRPVIVAPEEEEHAGEIFAYAACDSSGTNIGLVMLAPSSRYNPGTGRISKLHLVDSSGWLTNDVAIPARKLIGRLPERLGRADQLVFEESDKNWSLAGLRTICVIENGAFRVVRQLRWGSAWDEW